MRSPREETRCYAILSMQVTRVSVRAVTARGASRELECTMLVGGRSAGTSAPSHLRAEQVSAFSVKLAWHPSSSNFKHLVLLNGRIFLTCPPGQYKCLLTGECSLFLSFAEWAPDTQMPE